MPTPKSRVFKDIESGKITLSPSLIDFCGGNHAIAIFLTECVVWTRWAEGQGRSNFWRSQAEWYERCRLTKGKLNEARSLLEPLGIVISGVRKLDSGKTCSTYRIVWDTLDRFLERFHTDGEPPKRQIASRQWRASKSPDPADTLPEFCKSEIRESDESAPSQSLQIRIPGSLQIRDPGIPQIRIPGSLQIRDREFRKSDMGCLQIRIPSISQDLLQDLQTSFPPYPPQGEPEGGGEILEAEFFEPEPERSPHPDPEPPSDIPGPPPQHEHPGQAETLSRESHLRAGHQKILSFEARFRPRTQDPAYVLRDADGRLGFDPRLEAVAITNWSSMVDSKTGNPKYSVLRQALRRKFYEDRQVLDDFWAEVQGQTHGQTEVDAALARLGREVADRNKTQTQRGLDTVRSVADRMKRGESVGLW
jgi:hypothetical protein